jgi:hypothetical protein
MKVVFPKMTGAAYDRAREHFDTMSAVEAERLSKVHAMAVGELKRMTGLTLRPDGTVDEIALTRGLAGQDITRRMALRTLLFQIGAIARSNNPAPFDRCGAATGGACYQRLT